MRSKTGIHFLKIVEFFLTFESEKTFPHPIDEISGEHLKLMKKCFETNSQRRVTIK